MSDSIAYKGLSHKNRYSTAAPRAAEVPAVTHDPATDNLSLWLRSPDSVAGTAGTLLWSSKASAGSSGTASDYVHNLGYGDSVEQPSAALDGFTSVLWTGANPLLDSIDKVRALLGAGDSVAASYTVMYVIQPLASNTYGLNGYGRTDLTNPTIWGDPAGYVTHAIMSDAGICKIGVHHLNEDLMSGDGTTPVVWPGGFGTWRLLVIRYTSGGNVNIRINGSSLVDETVPANKGPSATDAVSYMGSLGSGAYVPSFRLAELMIYPGQALSDEQISARELGYFKARYPSLGL